MPDLHLPMPLTAFEGPPVGREAALLWRAARTGMRVAPIALVPVEVEVDHYRLNNLPARLDGLFRGVDRADPDEDDLEELCPEAEALVLGAALLDEVIERFYDAIAGMPPRLTVRRDGAAGGAVGHGRPALLALKRLWADEWSEDAIVERLRGGGSWAPEARPVLVHDAEIRAVEAEAAVDAPLPDVRRAWVDRDGRVARCELDPLAGAAFGP